MEIKLGDIRKGDPLKKVVSIRVPKKIIDWMENNKISPSRLFNETAKIVMKNLEEQENNQDEVSLSSIKQNTPSDDEQIKPGIDKGYVRVGKIKVNKEKYKELVKEDEEK